MTIAFKDLGKGVYNYSVDCPLCGGTARLEYLDVGRIQSNTPEPPIGIRGCGACDGGDLEIEVSHDLGDRYEKFIDELLKNHKDDVVDTDLSRGRLVSVEEGVDKKLHYVVRETWVFDNIPEPNRITIEIDAIWIAEQRDAKS